MKFVSINLALAVLLIASSCEKKESTEVDNTPTPGPAVELPVEDSSSAQATDDNKSSGVYKGTFVGSSGSFKLVIQSDEISGKLIVDGTGYLLTTTDISASDLGSAINNALFKDASETVRVFFSVDANGENPSAQVSINGHENIQVDVVKETSSNHVKVYEGLLYYSYGDSFNVYQCVFNANMVIKGNQGTTAVTYKYNSSNNIEGNSDCDTEDFGTINDYEYTINNNQINAFTYVTECDSCPPMIEGFLDINTNGTFSNESIFFESESWMTPSGMTLQDSVRFIRKL